MEGMVQLPQVGADYSMDKSIFRVFIKPEEIKHRIDQEEIYC
jgi:hypothetical protein